MKNKFICVSFMLAFSTVSLAQDVKFYENNISSIESLKMKLEQLELKKKILDVEIEIKEGSDKLQPTVSKAISTSSESKAVVRLELLKEESFDPKLVRLMYLVGSGDHVAAILAYKDKTENVMNGRSYKGWRLNIKDRKASLVKGPEVIEL
ncbi:hypothetical protein [Vibrio sp. N418]|uniref:hypothetical protein n=1 Tax=Vibrio sp. (strain N418) TaxID=701176 RepID=UPI000A311768|nr:hypothetical protein [Vibrio sp. N418]